MTGAISTERTTMARIFEGYCAFGDSQGRSTTTMTSRNFAKLAKDCKFVDSKLTSVVLDLAFTKASRASTGSSISFLDSSSGKRISYPQFQLALQFCAEAKSTTVQVLHKLMIEQAERGPSYHESATVATPQRFHDDKSTYTVLLRGDSKSKLIEKQGSVKQLPTARMPQRNSPVFAVFEQYAMFGETSGPAQIGLTSRNFIKLWRDLAMIDNNKLSTTILDLVFTKAARAPVGNAYSSLETGGKRLNYTQFLVACELVAEARGSQLENLYVKIGDRRHEGGPIMNTATEAEPTRLHDNKDTYTAVTRKEETRKISGAMGNAAIHAQVRKKAAPPLPIEIAANNVIAQAAVSAALKNRPMQRSNSLLPMLRSNSGLQLTGVLPIPREPANRRATTDVFESYARFGDTFSTGTSGLSSRNFQKMWKDCGIVELSPRKDVDKDHSDFSKACLSPTSLDLIYTRSSRAPAISSLEQNESSNVGLGKRLSFNQFLVACELIADARDQISGELLSLLLLKCGDGPSLSHSKPVSPNPR
mmetsp:Transcript_7725/g.19929  ORF Transcript_7725/g.19929 Transcript_7725/m.19929 type:complete len:533 (+) Transcript_7725:95-1693(+)